MDIKTIKRARKVFGDLWTVEVKTELNASWCRFVEDHCCCCDGKNCQPLKEDDIATIILDATRELLMSEKITAHESIKLMHNYGVDPSETLARFSAIATMRGNKSNALLWLESCDSKGRELYEHIMGVKL